MNESLYRLIFMSNNLKIWLKRNFSPSPSPSILNQCVHNKFSATLNNSNVLAYN